jgi:hypothetical protein
MYGHMLRVLHGEGMNVDSLIEQATAGIRFILRDRSIESGLVNVVHPWETGADDSPRWDSWSADGAGGRWRDEKDRFVTSLNVNHFGSSVSNPLFCVAPSSFNALVAFNALEIASMANDSNLNNEALELTQAIDEHYDPGLLTWADTAPDGSVTSVIRTLDALLPVLVSPHAKRVDQALQLTLDPQAFGAPFGPCGVDKREPTFNANTYWRGAAWPQLTYLFFVAASRSGNVKVREMLARNAIRAAIRSNFSEFLNPITGSGLGASLQSWACLPIVMLKAD